MSFLHDLQRSYAYRVSWFSQFLGWIEAVSALAIGDTSQPIFMARNVVPTDVPDLTSFVVAGNDGITNVQGDVVFLAAQTVTPEKGPWVVGVVTGGTAALTRPIWWPTGNVMPTSVRITIGNGGTLYGGTRWYFSAGTSPNFTIDVTAISTFPEMLTLEAVLIAGTFAWTPIPIDSPGNSSVSITRVLPVGTALTVEYGIGTIVAYGDFTSGPGNIPIEAQVAAGTINVADGSTLMLTLNNRG